MGELRNNRMIRAVGPIALSLVLIICFISCGCSPSYVLNAAYRQAKILSTREEISTVIGNSSTPESTRVKLSTVASARQFAKELGLSPGGSFRYYSFFPGEAVVWVVIGARPDAFELKTWWFPFVGTVPYKGFFEKKDAEQAAAALQAEGYETSVRGSVAFSTLGWFDDPVLTPLLALEESALINTVLHESLHSTIWIPGEVAFNESMANFVGLEGTVAYYESQLTACAMNPPSSPNSPSSPRASAPSTTDLTSHVAAAKSGREREILFSSKFTELFASLEGLYQSSAPREEKLERRQTIYQEWRLATEMALPNVKLAPTLNNAELMQRRLYFTKLDRFQKLFERVNGSWEQFLAKLRAIEKKKAEQHELDPFVLLEQEITP